MPPDEPLTQQNSNGVMPQSNSQLDGGVKPETFQPEPESEAPRRSLREIAEQTYDDIETGAPDEPAPETTVDEHGRVRDRYGRFVTKSGEAEAETPPSPDGRPAPQSPESATQQPPAGVSSGAPENWSAQDRQMFEKLPEEGKSFLIRRHSEMEGDYQRRVQATREATDFQRTLVPTFSDPVMSQNLQEAGWSISQAIQEWGGYHRRAIDPDVRVRAGFVAEMFERILPGIDPAAVFGQMSRSEPAVLSQEQQADPAIRYFADHISGLAQGVQGLARRLDAQDAQAHERAQAEAVGVVRSSIDEWADAKGPDGQPLRPFFNEALPRITKIYERDPNTPLAQAYEEACWADPAIRGKMQAQQAAQNSRQQADQRAAQAARANLRGRTVPVVAPRGENVKEDGSRRTLAETIAATADEIGF